MAGLQSRGDECLRAGLRTKVLYDDIATGDQLADLNIIVWRAQYSLLAAVLSG